LLFLQAKLYNLVWSNNFLKMWVLLWPFLFSVQVCVKGGLQVALLKLLRVRYLFSLPRVETPIGQ